MNEKRRKFLCAAIALAKRSETSTFQAKCQASADRAKHYHNRAYLQRLGQNRLLKLAGVVA